MNIIGYAEDTLDVECYHRAVRAGMSLAPMGFRTLLSVFADIVHGSEAVDEVREQHEAKIGDGLGADVVDLQMDDGESWNDLASTPLLEDLPTDDDFSLAIDLLAALGLKPGDSSGFEEATGLCLPDGVEIVVPPISLKAPDLPALLWHQGDEDEGEGLFVPIRINLLEDKEAGIAPLCAVVLVYLRPAE